MCLWVCLFGVGYHVCIDPHQRPSHAPRKGVCCRAKIFGSALLQPARSVCVSLRTFFMLPLLWSFSRYCIKQWTEQWPLCSLTPQLPTDDIHSIMVYSRSYRIAGRQIRCNFTNMVPDNVDCGDGKIFVGMGRGWGWCPLPCPSLLFVLIVAVVVLVVVVTLHELIWSSYYSIISKS